MVNKIFTPLAGVRGGTTVMSGGFGDADLAAIDLTSPGSRLVETAEGVTLDELRRAAGVARERV